LNKFRSWSFIVALVAVQSAAAAEGGKISGTVKSLIWNDAVPSAEVRLVDTKYNTTTDASGAYSFDGVAPGDYVLRVSFQDHLDANQKVSIVAGQPTTANVDLKPSGTQMGEVVVVSADKVPEKILTAPVTIQHVDSETVDRLAGGNYLQALQQVQGLYWGQAGLFDNRVTSRQAGKRAPKDDAMAVDPKRVQAVFLAVLEATDDTQRAAILDQKCASDSEMRAYVEALITSHRESATIFDPSVSSWMASFI